MRCTSSGASPSFSMAEPAVPMMADCVRPPAASPAASPLSRWNTLAITTTVTSPDTATTRAIRISLTDCRPSERKNCGPLSKPTA